MKLLLLIIFTYIAIGLIIYIATVDGIKRDQDMAEHFEYIIKALEEHYPDFNQQAIKTIYYANLVRECILWPRVLYGYLRQVIIASKNKRRKE